MALIEKILASLQDTRILLAVLSVLAVFIFMFTMNYDAPASDIPLIGYEPSFTYWKSKFKFIRDGKKILLEGMKVYYAYQYTARIYGNVILHFRDGFTTDSRAFHSWAAHSKSSCQLGPKSSFRVAMWMSSKTTKGLVSLHGSRM